VAVGFDLATNRESFVLLTVQVTKRTKGRASAQLLAPGALAHVHRRARGRLQRRPACAASGSQHARRAAALACITRPAAVPNARARHVAGQQGQQARGPARPKVEVRDKRWAAQYIDSKRAQGAQQLVLLCNLFTSHD